MATVASLNVEIGARIADLQKGLKSAERELRQSGAKLSRIGSEMTTALSIPLGLLGGSAIAAAGEFESLTLAMQATFKNAGRSVNEANAEVEALRKAALAPGLDFQQAVSASIRLQSVGLSAEDARHTIQELANAIASTGGTAENLSSVTVQMAQMISKGKVLAGDLRIVQENLPIISDLMQKAFGTSNAEMIQELGISGKDFVTKITAEMQNLNRVEGGISNAIVNAGSAIKQFLAGVGEEINKAFNISDAADKLGASLSSVLTWFRGLSDGTKKLIIEIGLAVVAFGPMLAALGAIKGGASQLVGGLLGLVGGTKNLISTVYAFVASMNAAKLSLGLVGLIIGVGAAVYALSDNFDAAEFAANKFSAAQETVINQTAEEIGMLNKSFDALKDETKSRFEKGKVVDDLLKQYPQYLKGIDLETASVEKLTEIQNSLNGAILRGVAERQKALAVNSIYEEQAKLLLRIQQIKDGGKVTSSEAGLIDTGEMIAAGGVAGGVLIKLQQQADELGKQVGVVSGQFDRAFGTINRAIDPTIQKEYDLRDAYYAEKDAQEANISTTKKHVATKAQISAATKAHKQEVDALAQAEKDEIEGLEKYAKMVNELEQAWLDEALAMEAAMNERAAAGPVLDTTGLAPPGGELGLQEAGINLSITGPDPAKTQEEVDAYKQAWVDSATDIADSVLGIFGAMSAIREQNELAELDRVYGKKLAAAKGNSTKEAAIQKEFEAKKAAIQKAAAKRQKQLALVEAIINTAVGVTKAISAAPPPFNIPLIVAAAAAGAAQIATISAQAFAKGTLDAPGGISLVGEQGPEIVNLPKHSQVFTASQTKSILNGGGSSAINLTGQFVIRGTDLVLSVDQTRAKQARHS